MEALKLIIFVGSSRDRRVGDRVLKYFKKKLADTNHEVKVFDPKVMQFEVLREALYFYEDPSQAPQWMHDAAKEIEEADAYIIVTPEYNSTIPPALTNMMDHFSPASFAYKPTAICTYSIGPYGGSRCNAALRSFIGDLGSVPVPYGWSICSVLQQLDENGNPLEMERMEKQMTKLLTSLEWYAEATRRHRQMSPPGPYVNH